MDNKMRQQIDIINQKMNEMNALYHTASVKSNISDGEMSILVTLMTTKEQLSQQDLCQILFLSKQTVNSVISGLVKKGIVSLEHISGTRNIKVVRITDEGLVYCRNNIQWIIDAEENAMEYTDPVEVQACISMLEKFIALFRKQIDGKEISYK